MSQDIKTTNNESNQAENNKVQTADNQNINDTGLNKRKKNENKTVKLDFPSSRIRRLYTQRYLGSVIQDEQNKVYELVKSYKQKFGEENMSKVSELQKLRSKLFKLEAKLKYFADDAKRVKDPNEVQVLKNELSNYQTQFNQLRDSQKVSNPNFTEYFEQYFKAWEEKQKLQKSKEKISQKFIYSMEYVIENILKNIIFNSYKTSATEGFSTLFKLDDNELKYNDFYPLFGRLPSYLFLVKNTLKNRSKKKAENQHLSEESSEEESDDSNSDVSAEENDETEKKENLLEENKTAEDEAEKPSPEPENELHIKTYLNRLIKHTKENGENPKYNKMTVSEVFRRSLISFTAELVERFVVLTKAYTKRNPCRIIKANIFEVIFSIIMEDGDSTSDQYIKNMQDFVVQKEKRRKQSKSVTVTFN